MKKYQSPKINVVELIRNNLLLKYKFKWLNYTIYNIKQSVLRLLRMDYLKRL